MRVNNQTSDPVDWEQTGGGPNEDEVAEDCPKKGHLKVGESTDDFKPCGTSPYTVLFLSTSGKERTAEAAGIEDANAQVIATSFPLVIP